MPLLDRAKEAVGLAPGPIKIPGDVDEKLKRGRERLREITPRRKVAVEFANGNHYCEVSGDGLKLNKQSTVSVSQGGKKPDHRVRRSRDLIGPIVKAKISASTKAIPRYEAIPSSPDAEDFTAARLAGKVARGGYDLWRVRKARKKLAWHAIVEEEGFIVPFWDSSIGPFIQVDQEGPEGEVMGSESIGMGEVGLLVLGGQEVFWEPGVQFEDSPWWGIENARPVEVVEAEPGFIGPGLTADADSSDKGGTRKKEAGSKLVMVTEFLERPCAKYSKGREMVFANGRMIFPEDTYRLRNEKDEVVDEPCIHRLSYSMDGSSDRDRGLVPSLIESMRAYDHAANKEAEYLQLVLVPQADAPAGAVQTPITDEPGLIVEWDPMALGAMNGKGLNWRQLPSMPNEYGDARDRAQAELGVISHDNQIPQQKAESGKLAQTLASKDALAWEDFIEDFAEVDARVMRDCLCLVQRHYTEDRLVKFRGRTGWENIADFKGADIRGQTDIYVPPASLEARTRLQTEQRIQNIAQMFPGHFPPALLISALEGGSAEKLIEGYEDDVAFMNRIIAQIRSGKFWSLPPRPVFPGEEGIAFDPETGQPEIDPATGEAQMITQLPGWMPRPFDDVPVQKSVLQVWLKSDDWANLDEAGQRASIMVYQGLLTIEAKEAQRQQELQNAMAAEAGLSNAAKPGEKVMPSLPSAEPEAA